MLPDAVGGPVVALPGGSCLNPGVPEGVCAEGFVPDGAWRCQPTLPAQPCPFGSVAVPGDTECREIMACGDLVTQSVDGAPALPPAVSDLGGNLCGCPEATGECKAAAADLSPPSPLP